MFGLFVENVLYNFWSNVPGDIFFDITCEKLKFEKSTVDLTHYFGLSEVPEFYEFDADKKLIIKKQVTTQTEVPGIDLDGNPTVEIVETTDLVVDKIIEPVVYVSKGFIVKPC